MVVDGDISLSVGKVMGGYFADINTRGGERIVCAQNVARVGEFNDEAVVGSEVVSGFIPLSPERRELFEVEG